MKLSHRQLFRIIHVTVKTWTAKDAYNILIIVSHVSDGVRTRHCYARVERKAASDFGY